MSATPHSPDFLSEIISLDASITALFTLSAHQLIHRPAPAKWSAIQAIDHIVLTNSEFFEEIERAIDHTIAKNRPARNRPTVEPFTYSWFDRLIVSMFEPPPKLRLPMPTRRIAPEKIPDIDVVKQAYKEHHNRFTNYIQEAMTVDMRRTKVRSPFLIERWVPLNLGTAIGTLLAHGRRHVYQANAAARMAAR